MKEVIMNNKKYVIILFSAILFVTFVVISIIMSKDNFDNNYLGAAFFRGNDSIYAYKDGKTKKLIDTNSPGFPKYIENIKSILWISDDRYINIYNIESLSGDIIETHYNIYDCLYTDNYIIFSGFDNDSYNYVICLMDISTGEEICISDTQNNQVVFSLYNDEIYFLEPSDDNHLYKYDITLKEKSLVSNLVENKSSVRMILYACEQGIFFTKAVFYETGTEQHCLYKLQDGEIIKVADNVDNIIGAENNNIYVEDLYGVYKIDLNSLERTSLIQNNNIINVYHQNQYLICETLDWSNDENEYIYIYDINREESHSTIKLWDI